MCEPGAFSDNPGTPECSLCSPGHVVDISGAEGCDACPQGYEQPKAGATECKICPEGTYTDSEGSDNCVSCPRGTYQNKQGGNTCSPCPDGKTTSAEGTTGIEKCYWEQCPIGYHRNSETNDCDECSQGTFTDTVESPECTPCAMGFFNPIRRQRKCLQCPVKHWTRSTGSIHPTDCIGPIMTMCDGTNMTGNCTTYYDVELSVPFTAQSLEVKAGKFKVCSGKKMYLKCEMISYPFRVDDVTDDVTRQLSFSPLSLESDIDDSFCYENRGEEFAPTRFYNATINGHGCKNWMDTQHPEAGDSTYCANPDPKQKSEPWCYTHDPAVEWEYCSVPKCVWDFECYTGTGFEYRGTLARTEQGYTCQNWQSDWPHPHSYHRGNGAGDHNYGRNPGNNERAPWCFTTNLFKRWDYVNPGRCSRDKFPFYKE
ncbi:plasminogen-like [Bolinopsis microptera]|uniref:plasminogen-like n=1 Tax=Bolinopsis microptera TaxID=2820187 RepID=UPI00307ACDB0